MKISVKYKVIYRHRKEYPISEICRFFEVSRSGYYGYVSRMDALAKICPLLKKYESVRQRAGTHMDTAECVSGLNAKASTTTLKPFSE